MHEQGDLFHAITAYERAVELRPNLFHALRALAALYEQKGFRRKPWEAVSARCTPRRSKTRDNHAAAPAQAALIHGPARGRHAVHPQLRARDRSAAAGAGADSAARRHAARPRRGTRALDEAEAAPSRSRPGSIWRRWPPSRALSHPGAFRADFLAEEFRIYESRNAGATPCCCARPRFRRSSRSARPGRPSDPHGRLRGLLERRGDRPGWRCRAPGSCSTIPTCICRFHRRTLVLVHSFSPEARGRADAALDPGLTDAASFRRPGEEDL